MKWCRRGSDTTGTRRRLNGSLADVHKVFISAGQIHGKGYNLVGCWRRNNSSQPPSERMKPIIELRVPLEKKGSFRLWKKRASTTFT